MADLASQAGTPRINLAEEPDFDVGGLRVLPAERAVELNGERKELQPRVMQVLVALAKARPAVVSRDRLVEQCWNGRIVGDDALNRCILALRHIAQEFSPAPFTIETVPRVGHRLVESVSVSEPLQTSRAPLLRFTKTWGVAIGLLALLAIATGLFFGQQRSSAAEPASIAVLPFRNVGTGDPYFAEGIGEEILGQLAREPNFRVAGSSSSSQFGSNPNVKEVAERLEVDYVLEGSVRRQGNQVRVNAGLVRASDGIRLWSESYDRKLTDVLEIQTAIGEAVARGLKRRLVRGPASASRTVNGEAYALYLTARGLLRTRNPILAKDAAGLLRRAIAIDPNFAAAWSRLAEAIIRDTDEPEEMIAVMPDARAAAVKALRLDPELAEAHGNLGILLGYDTPAAIGHFRRAAALDPRSSENLVWLGMAHLQSGEFAKERAAYRRAHELDPLWHRATRDLAFVIAEMGDRRAAEAVARTAFPNDLAQQYLLLGRIARLFGDFSEAARFQSIVANTDSPQASPAKSGLAATKFLVGLADDLRPFDSINLDQPRALYPVSGVTLSPGRWQQQNRSSIAALVYADGNIFAAKLMLKAGRARALVATYDRASGLLRMKRGEPVRVSQLHQVPLVALALRDAGRTEEADALLRQADALLRATYARGTVPNWFEADAAAIWTVQGRTELALRAIERALDRGWVHAGRHDLRQLSDEPAFAALRAQPRFAAAASRLDALYARERVETARVLKIPL